MPEAAPVMSAVVLRTLSGMAFDRGESGELEASGVEVVCECVSVGGAGCGSAQSSEVVAPGGAVSVGVEGEARNGA